ncbi:MAG: threonine--tRNA ligase [Patescibacteria group bacterium]|jgi:threonyl-tRNA synthetase
MELDHIRHSLAHLLASAVLEIRPDAKLGVGPVIEDGFYYDFQLEKPITEEELPKLQKRMRELANKQLGFDRMPVSAAEAKKTLKGQPFKHELIDEFTKEGQELTLYKTGEFIDLCRGGHVENTKEIPVDAFKLTKLAGAYWRGDEKNPQLTRIYGVAFTSKDELAAYEQRMVEAAKRDHRKLGTELDLYSFHSVAPGAVFWHPRGMVIWNELENLLREKLNPRGYEEIQTPLMVKPELFEKSGHLAHYKDNMFRVENPQKEEFYLKPMNCPESTFIYASHVRSYRDLPIKLAEIGRIHRNELSGALGGLFRVRQITQDDGHVYCRPDQLEQQITEILELSKEIYEIFNITPSFFLSTKPDNAMGDAKLWEQAETALAQALRNNHLEFKEKPKDGTFYAPKIDIDITDAIGRRWQLCTIQADLVMVPSFDGVEYTNEQSKKVKPVVIHRAIFGSFERFIGILVEHFAGEFPLWLSPEQIALLPVSEKFIEAAEKIRAEFSEAGIRAMVDHMDESVGKKTRNAVKRKVPYVLVIGEKEANGKKVAVRKRGEQKAEEQDRKKFIAQLQKSIATRSRKL